MSLHFLWRDLTKSACDLPHNLILRLLTWVQDTSSSGSSSSSVEGEYDAEKSKTEEKIKSPPKVRGNAIKLFTNEPERTRLVTHVEFFYINILKNRFF